MTAKYKVVEAALERDLIEGKFEDNRKLPTEDELIEIYKVSRNTIRRAVDVMARRGMIMPIQGSGMFLRDVFQEGCVNLEVFRGMTDTFKNNRLETKVIAFDQIFANEEIAKSMRCDVGTPMFYLERVRIVDGIPNCFEYSWLNRNYIPYLNNEIITNSVYEFITSDPKKKIGYVDRVITARRLTEKEAKMLGLKEGDPALVSTNCAMFKAGELFDYSINVHNFETVKFLKLSNFA